ncbi:MAG TPA: retroviral-like aspartic protease family protein [Rhodopila sp.]|jgi:predicted aspartyl protease|nr:retroviral-like aspartic protease family protein [Rhodopila sp.]
MASLRRVFGLLLLLVLAGCDTPPAIDCNLTMIARMPLRVEDHLLVVPAGINGKWVHLIVDSGAERTTISDATAERLGLPHDPHYKYQSMGIGGTTVSTDVTVDRLVLGGVHFPVDHIAVGSFNLQTVPGLTADGLLGADILLAFDMDIDVPDGTLTLYRSRLCPDVRPPWQEPWMEITGVRARKDRLLLPVELDDVDGMALLDTGAQGNLLGVAMARRLGLDDQTLARDPPVRNIGTGGATMSRLHRFKHLRIGPVVEAAPAMLVLPSDFGVGDALIGEQFLQDRRVWLSFRNRQVFVSRRVSEQ